MDLPLSPVQLQSVRESTARVNVWVGSIRAGKTIASLLRFLIAVAVAGHGGEIVITGRTRDSIFRNVISPLMDATLFGSVSRRIRYNQGAPTANILGRTVHIIGASDAKAALAIRGMTVLIWYCDEVTVHPESFIVQMLGRMSPPTAQAFMTTNPDGPRHWFKIKFIDRAIALHWLVWQFTLGDNPSLTAEYVASIKAEFTGMWYARYIEGLWAAAEGAIYDMFDESKHVGSIPDGVTILRRVVGLDYGTNNAFVALMLGLGSDNRLYVLSEWRHDARHGGAARWTDGQLSAGMRRWLDAHSAGPRIEWVAHDPSSASFGTQLFADGVNNAMLADNSVLTGLRTVASLFALGRLQIVDAPGLIDEIPGYVWDHKAAERGEDKPAKDAGTDNGCDALRYAVMTALSVWGLSTIKGVPSAAAA